MTSRLATALPLLLLGPASAGFAAADFAGARPVGGLLVYPDTERSDLYYYGPGPIALATESTGKPKVHLLEVRYTGTAATGDQGRIAYRSLLSLSVVETGAGPEQLSAARAALSGGGRAELRPLAIQRLESALVYAPLRPGPSEPAVTPLPAGHFETSENGGLTGAAGYWSERTYTLPLDPEEAQLFWRTLQDGQVTLSLAYAFVARGAGAAPDLTLPGDPSLAGSLRERLEAAISRREGSPEADERVVRAGATAVTIDVARWPDLLRREDINESLPPGYAALSIYCYDFQDASRTDLFEKQVQIEARSVTDQTVRLAAVFRRAESDVFAHSLRFPVAVRLDRPFRYRVSEVSLDGTTRESSWHEGGDWSRILDVTGSPAEKEGSDHAANP